MQGIHNSWSVWNTAQLVSIPYLEFQMKLQLIIYLIRSSPITTGTSVVGIKFDGGVMIAADNLVSYGSLARYQDVQRVFKVNNKTIMGAGGDFADFQSLKRSIDQKIVEDLCHGDDLEMKPKSLYNWLTRVFYNRRSRFNPLWLEMVVGGLDNGEPFLGHVDLRGRAYEDDVVATGFGKHLALPLVREQLVEGKKLTQEQASDVVCCDQMIIGKLFLIFQHIFSSANVWKYYTTVTAGPCPNIQWLFVPRMAVLSRVHLM